MTYARVRNRTVAYDWYLAMEQVERRLNAIGAPLAGHGPLSGYRAPKAWRGLAPALDLGVA